MRSMEDKDPDKMGRNPRRPQVLGIPLLLGLEGPSEDMRRFCSLFTVLKFCLYWSIIYVLEKSLMLGKIEGTDMHTGRTPETLECQVYKPKNAKDYNY